MADKRAVKRDTLHRVNDIRAIYKLKPLRHLEKGTPCIAECCPISNSIRKGVEDRLTVSTACRIEVRDNDAHDRMIYELGDAANDFIELFDGHKYPEMIRWK